jgi:predicted GNAT family acetyltransferase
MQPASDRAIQFQENDTQVRYFIAMPNGEDAHLKLVKLSAGHVIASSTFVPEPFRGQGIAEDMVERLIDDARARGWAVTPSCWFVADEFARHAPDWDDVLKL